MKEVTVTLTLLVNDDTNPRKWIPEAIYQNLEPNESLQSYTQTEEEDA